MIPRPPASGPSSRPSLHHRPQDALRTTHSPGRSVREPRPVPEPARDEAGHGASDGAQRDALVQASRRGLRLIGVAALLGCLQVLFMIGVELDRSIRHGAAIGALEGELADLAREAEALRAVEAHADDDVYREQLARAQGFMYPGEARLVVLPPPLPPARP